MYQNKTVAVVVPSYNVDKQIGAVIKTMPKFLDKIIVVDDASKDKTAFIVKKLKRNNNRIILLQHKDNQGVGGAVATGYKWCKEHEIDIAVVMDGDGQMLPIDLPKLIDPVAKGEADYAKANRLFSEKAYKTMPKLRYFGNSILSFFTKIASGYWSVTDSQSGFRAINKKMLQLINWDKMYKRYGYPNDILVRLNIYNARVIDIPVEPVYNIGEKSKMNLFIVLFTIPAMLIRMFFWRLKEKYIIRDFHPLVLFYLFGFFSFISAIILLVREIYILINTGLFYRINFLAFMLCSLMAVQFVLFAMWFDMDYNKEFYCRPKDYC